MKETGIIMSGNHPRLILDGTKTMTRRVVKDPRENQRRIQRQGYGHGIPSIGDLQREIELTKDTPPNVPCPYGQVGDRLWVRETWAELGWYENASDVVHLIDDREGDERYIIYAEECQTTFEWRGEDGEIEYTKAGYERSHWKPSIHMPRWASRITLEITEVRVERVQEITEEDAIAEGCYAEEPKTWWQGYREIQIGDLGVELMHQQAIGEKPPDSMLEPHKMLDRPDLLWTARKSFIPLWDSLNAKRGFGWSDNPWVWVISFKKENK